MATTRLRKAFKYPEDTSDADRSRDELDEEEQETLISDLRIKETEQNARYKLIFTVLPLVLALPFLIYIPSSAPRHALLCVLAVTSLSSTAYTMHYIPAEQPNSSRGLMFLSQAANGPIEQYLPLLDGAISCLLFFAAWTLKGRSVVDAEHEHTGLWVLLLLPGMMFVMVMVVRKSIADVEAGLKDLNNLKYDYKGA